jgi:hypothetical protein
MEPASEMVLVPKLVSSGFCGAGGGLGLPSYPAASDADDDDAKSLLPGAGLSESEDSAGGGSSDSCICSHHKHGEERVRQRQQVIERNDKIAMTFKKQAQTIIDTQKANGLKVRWRIWSPLWPSPP